jgi:hypothetical protein
LTTVTPPISYVQDAAYPAQAPLKSGVTISAGYIGGDALNVWTASDWAAWATRYRVPIWVRSDPSSVDPTEDANACVAALSALSAPEPFLVLPYGSESTLFSNPEIDGYWVAAPGSAGMYPQAGVVATQYYQGSAYDLSEILQSVPTWDTQEGTGPTAVMLDLETAVDAAWVTTFAAVVKAGGTTVEAVGIQDGWSFCIKCGGLFFSAATANVCPAGGAHSAPAGDSYDYSLLHD